MITNRGQEEKMSKVGDKLRQKWEGFSAWQKFVLLVFGLIVSFILITALFQGAGKLMKKNDPVSEQIKLDTNDPEDFSDQDIPTFRIPDDATDDEVDSLLMDFYNNI